MSGKVFDMGKNHSTYAAFSDIPIVDSGLPKKIFDENMARQIKIEAKLNSDLQKIPCSKCGHVSEYSGRVITICGHRYKFLKRNIPDRNDMIRTLEAIDFRVVKVIKGGQKYGKTVTRGGE